MARRVDFCYDFAYKEHAFVHELGVVEGKITLSTVNRNVARVVVKTMSGEGKIDVLLMVNN